MFFFFFNSVFVILFCYFCTFKLNTFCSVFNTYILYVQCIHRQYTRNTLYACIHNTYIMFIFIHIFVNNKICLQVLCVCVYVYLLLWPVQSVVRFCHRHHIMLQLKISWALRLNSCNLCTHICVIYNNIQ